ncbi:MAG: carboxypeptidase-like regulatory domain-containing protein, partial [Calditrichaeota bacterium]|nr:carboxypeptidase-like regulatory domain-containing protein [Calditrichota bacterium]
MLPVSSRILHTRLSFFLFTLFCISIIISISYAGTTGKIVGKITEKDTGEPIIGANVQGVNQTWGAATDMDGEFTILNISPGIYELEISHVEYHTITMENVNINIDLTTELDIELTVATMKLEEARVKVVKKIIEIGTSDSRTRIDAAKIKDLRPEDVTTLIKTVPGFKQDEEGSFHVRGSRKGEVAFIVDGVDFRDPLVSTITNISLGSQNISEVNILTGGFSAEYGRAMGAIVQITTAEGPEKSYTGRFEYQTDRVFDDYSFDTDRGEFALGGPVPYSKKFIGKPVTFFFTTIGKITNTYTPFDINRPANDYIGLGVKLPERQINNYSSSLKLAYKITDTKKLSLYLTESFNKWDIYPNGEGGISGNYGYAYKYNLDNRPSAE